MLSFLRAITALAFLVHATLGCGLLHADGCGMTANAACTHSTESIGHGHGEGCSDHGVDGATEFSQVQIAPSCCCQSMPDRDRHDSQGRTCEFVFVSPEHSNVIALPIVSAHELAWQSAPETSDRVASLAKVVPRHHASFAPPAARCAVLCIWRI